MVSWKYFIAFHRTTDRKKLHVVTYDDWGEAAARKAEIMEADHLVLVEYGSAQHFPKGERRTALDSRRR